jgi:hypothetical protein
LTYLLWSDIDEPQEGMLRIIIRGSKPVELEERILVSSFLQSQFLLKLMFVISLPNTKPK